MPFTQRLPKINTSLLAINIVVALYILVVPFSPALLFIIRERTATQPVFVSEVITPQGEPQPDFPSGKRLVIPALFLDEEIYEDDTPAALNNGVWHRPNSSSPTVGGNTVFAGHLFAYEKPEGVFYHLNKLKIGDKIATYWEGSEYLYQIFEKKEVAASAIEIEAQTSDDRLTLYTCTPLWNPVNRLVLTAKLMKVTAR